MKRQLKSAVMLLALLCVFELPQTIANEQIEAQWKVYQIHFRYTGFAAHYTCDGIEYKLKRLVELLGARDDVRIENSCFGTGNIERFHRVLLAFALPVPADKTELDNEIIPAQWQEIEISGRRERYIDEGDCELVEQFYRQVIPKLGFKKIKNRLRCIPGRRDFNALNLRLTGLKAMKVESLEQNRQE